MKKISLLISFFLLGILACGEEIIQSKFTQYPPKVNIVSAMRNVMWKGELKGNIYLDTIKNKKGLYGLGPLEGLGGELLIIDGVCYVSKVNSDKLGSVSKNCEVSAPFFVYTHVEEWLSDRLPSDINSIKELELYLGNVRPESFEPYIFKLEGMVKRASIHIQNLPYGSVVSSPKIAHKGQVKYGIRDKDVKIIGFFSRNHQGVFTHHDSYVHMHLITQDESLMGHLDDVVFGKMEISVAL